MDKFKSKFFEKSPIKEIARGKAGRLRKKAQRISERSGETGAYDYTNMKVLRLLDKAKKIENRNFIKSLGFKEGSKRKKSDSNSPFQGAYTSAAGQGKTYVSNREAFQQLQNDIVEGAKGVDEALRKVLKMKKEIQYI